MKIKLIVENRVGGSDLLAEHGLAYLITYHDKQYLLDTGQGMVLLNNLKQLGISVDQLDGILLSHGHYDHTNGLQDILSYQPQISVYGHPELFTPKYSQTDNKLKFSGIDISREEIENFTPITELTAVEEALYLTGEIPRKNKQETIPPKFKKDLAGEIKPDNFIDDQSLVLKTDTGLVILLSCTHAGVINTLDYIQKEFSGQRIRTIMGGMHLVNASLNRIEETIEYLAALEFEQLVPLHCTGTTAVKMMIKRFNERVELAQVGDEFCF
ncbi:MAG: MBL fold metallo-hydrolase [Bacillota bacterium]